MGAHMTKKPNSCMEQSKTFRTNKVCQEASGCVIGDSELAEGFYLFILFLFLFFIFFF